MSDDEGDLEIDRQEAKEISESKQDEPGSTTGSVPFWTETRKIFLAQGLALVATPLSVAITLILTEHYKAPKPDIQYVGSTINYFIGTPDINFREKFDKERGAAGVLRQELALRGKPDCQGWLDGDAWDSNCAGTYLNAVNSLLSVDLTAQVKAFKGGQTPFVPTAAEASRIQALFKEFQQDLKRAAAEPPVRSGDAVFKVGVLNKGASDGTIAREATLSFNDQHFKLYADDYVAIKAHSFEKISFSTPGISNGKPQDGEWDPAEESAIKAWASLLTSGKAIDYRIEIAMPEDMVTDFSGTLPAESTP